MPRRARPTLNPKDAQPSAQFRPREGHGGVLQRLHMAGSSHHLLPGPRRPRRQPRTGVPRVSHRHPINNDRSWFGTFRLISFYPLLPSSAPSSLTPRPVAPALPHSGHSPEACPQMAWGSSSPLPAATSPQSFHPPPHGDFTHLCVCSLPPHPLCLRQLQEGRCHSCFLSVSRAWHWWTLSKD